MADRFADFNPRARVGRDDKLDDRRRDITFQSTRPRGARLYANLRLYCP